jgi:hypothetical protein
VKVLVCGGRDFSDRALVTQTLCALDPSPTLIIHGDAPGADRLADEWARWWDVPVSPYPADWKRLGRRAGPVRNQMMLDREEPGLVVAFPGGRGTADMVRRAEAKGVRVLRVADMTSSLDTNSVASPSHDTSTASTSSAPTKEHP